MRISLPRCATLRPDLPDVLRLGLATRGDIHLKMEDVEHAIERGINYLNWCGHPDALSHTIARSAGVRRKLVVAVQFEARTAIEAERELAELLRELGTDYIDVLTLYYVESESEWEVIAAPGGALEFLERQKQQGTVKLIGLTSHQRRLAAGWAETKRLDLLMIRYNAAHRGAELDVFPVTARLNMPVVTFTGLRWGALLEATPDDPPGFQPPPAVDFYRFCLSNANVAVALMGPGNRVELDANLALLDDWKASSLSEIAELRAHGDRVYRHAGTFW